MTRNFVPFARGVGVGVGVCLASWFIGMILTLAGLGRVVPSVLVYLWPASAFLIRDPNTNPALFWIVFAFGVAANALLYGLVFVVIAFLFRCIRGRRQTSNKSLEPTADRRENRHMTTFSNRRKSNRDSVSGGSTPSR